ncbi:MAG: imidazoleglycerol-phosphate dehydratase HisB [Akkermansia sp.]
MRQDSHKRTTGETDIEMTVNVDGTGCVAITTGHPFFDHMLDLFARHSLIDVTLTAKGDLDVDAHHTVEDVAIVMGDCIKNALGDKKGIVRYGCSYLPMDETLTRVVVDLSNRPYLVFKTPEGAPDAPNFPLSLCEEFCRALSNNLRCNLHVEVLYGRDGHHIAESIFKGLAHALRIAVDIDPRVANRIPSTKGSL